MVEKLRRSKFTLPAISIIVAVLFLLSGRLNNVSVPAPVSTGEKLAPPAQARIEDRFRQVVRQAHQQGRNWHVTGSDTHTYQTWLFTALLYAESKSVFTDFSDGKWQRFQASELPYLHHVFSLFRANYRSDRRYDCVANLFGVLRMNRLVEQTLANAGQKNEPQAVKCFYRRSVDRAVRGQIARWLYSPEKLDFVRKLSLESGVRGLIDEITRNYRIDSDSQRWLAKSLQKSEVRNLASLPRQYRLIHDKVMVRSRPTFSARVLPVKFKKDTPVEVVRHHGVWVEIELQKDIKKRDDIVSGWVHSRLLQQHHKLPKMY